MIKYSPVGTLHMSQITRISDIIYRMSRISYSQRYIILIIAR